MSPFNYHNKYKIVNFIFSEGSFSLFRFDISCFFHWKHVQNFLLIFTCVNTTY